MTREYINYTNYSNICNRIAYWLVNNNKKFNVRQVYGYMNRTADYGTIIKVIKERGTNYQSDSLSNFNYIFLKQTYLFLFSFLYYLNTC